MAVSKLEKLANALKSKVPEGRINFTVPDIWNAWDYQGPEMRRLPSEELLVNPYSFYSSLINACFLVKKDPQIDYQKPLSKINNEKITSKGGDWLHRASLYSMMPRASAAWDHDRSHSLDLDNLDHLKETGTFVKALALLPFLDKLGINTIYLLPLTRYSETNKKGELGSPYAVSSSTELDPNLKDDLCLDMLTLEEEFQAFVEACHLMQMRVTIDIMPRTIARDNTLIKDHPDWFYWIKVHDFDQYQVPRVEGLPNTLPPNPEHMEKVYASPSVKKHLALFQQDPKTTNESLWAKLLEDNPDNLQEAIKEHYGLMVAPAFSDHINDIQPPWSDITFLRFYFDHPTANRSFLENPDTPPYILFDTIKANLYPGEKPNRELWDLLSGIIPKFQKKYGIDGARIDMGHALPKALLENIMASARNVDHDFGFIAEELNPANAKTAKELGYNILVGNSFWMEPRVKEGYLREFINRATESELPMYACSETHDSARIANRNGGLLLSRMLTVVNMLLPNRIPFINSGQEFYETQPMNIGVDCTIDDRYSLPETDLFYGKLALFDKYAFHYLHPQRWELADLLQGIIKIRKQWLPQLLDKEASLVLSFWEESCAIAFGYYNKDNGDILIVAMNPDFENDIQVGGSISRLRELAKNHNTKGKLLYSTYEFGGDFHGLSLDTINLHLQKCEVKIITF
ncbi:MAG: hypothetical protein PHI01_01505 [Candidatus Izemoplasmatales bacterium]|nr:hypothetical protein [Candidatus Izemoplasmatales bacterium]